MFLKAGHHVESDQRKHFRGDQYQDRRREHGHSWNGGEGRSHEENYKRYRENEHQDRRKHEERKHEERKHEARLESRHHHDRERRRSREHNHSHSQPLVSEESHEHRHKEEKRKSKHQKHLRSHSLDRHDEKKKKKKKSHHKHHKSRKDSEDERKESSPESESEENERKEKKNSDQEFKRRQRDESDQGTTFLGELLKNSKIDKEECSLLMESVAKSKEKKKDVEEGEIASKSSSGSSTDSETLTPPIHLLTAKFCSPKAQLIEKKSFTPPIHLLKVTDLNQNEIEPVLKTSDQKIQEKKQILSFKPVSEPSQKKKSVLELPMPPVDFICPLTSFNLKRSALKAFSPTEFKVKHRDDHYKEVCSHLTANPTVISPNEAFVDNQPLRRPRTVKIRPTVINRKPPQREFVERGFETFKIKELIGEGTYGRVYKAMDLIKNELVALKYVRMEKEVEGFPITGLREIKILRELQHPNVVEFREIVYREGADKWNIDTFLVFEYMNYDLMGLLDNPAAKFDEDSIFLIFKQLLEGLNYCHKRKILHRDLKCSNILVNKAGEVKLADFGLGRQWEPERPYTNKVISLWYRPIELLLGEEKYGPPVDVWSLGCIFGELFQRRPVFPFGSELEIINGIFQLCGSPTKNSWPEVKLLPGYATLHPVATRRTILDAYKNIIPPLALGLFDKMLTLNPAARISAEDALQSNWITFMSAKKNIKPLVLPKDDDCHELGAKMRRKKRSSSKN